ncbi:MAG: hypothetical protein WA728_04470 [Xanthobacteraceae bacterium]
MNRTAIAATIVTSILAFSSPSLAASDEELGHIGDKMSGAFKCSIYASIFDNLKEQQRLFQIGLKAARDFVEGMKSRPPLNELQTYMPGASTDFVVGQMYADQSSRAENEIKNGLSSDHLLDADARKREAELNYRKSNCSLIQ